MRRSEELLEARLGELACLGQEREDPAAIVVGDDDAQVGAPCLQSGQRSAVVDERDVADDGDRGLAAQCDAECRRDDAIDAIGAAVGVCPRRPATEPFEVAHRHGGRNDELRIRRKVLGDRSGHARLGEGGQLAEHLIDGSLRSLVG